MNSIVLTLSIFFSSRLFVLEVDFFRLRHDGRMEMENVVGHTEMESVVFRKVMESVYDRLVGRTVMEIVLEVVYEQVIEIDRRETRMLVLSPREVQLRPKVSDVQTFNVLDQLER